MIYREAETNEVAASRKRPAWITLLAISALLITAISCSGYLMAKYRTQAESGDGARVAKWSVSTDLPETIEDLTVGTDTTSYILTLHNASEVDVNCSISIEGLPQGIVVELYPIVSDARGTKLGERTQGATGNVEFASAKVFSENGTATYELVLSAPAENNVVCDEYEITFDVVYTQID